jgi:hypothetical protein
MSPDSKQCVCRAQDSHMKVLQQIFVMDFVNAARISAHSPSSISSVLHFSTALLRPLLSRMAISMICSTCSASDHRHQSLC